MAPRLLGRGAGRSPPCRVLGRPRRWLARSRWQRLDTAEKLRRSKLGPLVHSGNYPDLWTPPVPRLGAQWIAALCIRRPPVAGERRLEQLRRDARSLGLFTPVFLGRHFRVQLHRWSRADRLLAFGHCFTRSEQSVRDLWRKQLDHRRGTSGPSPGRFPLDECRLSDPCIRWVHVYRCFEV